MLDIGWSELILIGVVALIVIGPKDLPEMFRQLGRFTAKMRSMARDFSRAMEQAANESGVKDVAKDLKSITTPQSLGMTAMKDAAAKFEKWDPLKNAATPTKAAAPAAAVAAAAVAPAATATPAPTVGPETQALLDRQAARQAIVAESAQRLKELTATPPAAPSQIAEPPPAAAKPKPRTKSAKPAEAAAAPKPSAAALKPAAKRKTKKADDA